VVKKLKRFCEMGLMADIKYLGNLLIYFRIKDRFTLVIKGELFKTMNSEIKNKRLLPNSIVGD
jgi:hypothetical protein